MKMDEPSSFRSLNSTASWCRAKHVSGGTTLSYTCTLREDEDDWRPVAGRLLFTTHADEGGRLVTNPSDECDDCDSKVFNIKRVCTCPTKQLRTEVIMMVCL
jgi:hypothetical protein